MKYQRVRRTPRSRSTQQARGRLKEHATPAERALLRALEHVEEPYTFQFTVRTAEATTGFYIVDFYLPARRLLVELDGKPHTTQRGIWNDRLRTEAILRARPGDQLVRYWNGDVIADPARTVEMLRARSAA